MWHVRGTGEVHRGFWWVDLRERDHLENKGVEGEDNIKIDIQEAILGAMDWIALAQHRDGWWTVVNAVMNRRVP